MPESNNSPLIFSTRTLSPALSELIEQAGLRFQQKDFIQVSFEYTRDSFLKSLNNPDSQARVFTSKNAILSMRRLYEEQPFELSPKKTFTVGIKATEMLRESFGLKTAVRADNAISLAQIIARNDDVSAVDFFCGDQSLDDLPEYLESKGIKVNKEVVYHTELVPSQIDTSPLQGIIFLSPTAVYSFFRKNKIDPSIPAFCIGATTSEAIHLRCDNPRIPSDEPVLDSVVQKVIEYFNHNQQSGAPSAQS